MLHLLKPAIDSLRRMEAACAEAEIATRAQRQAAKELREFLEKIVPQDDPRDRNRF